jgi:uncharacterized protein involved in high-affinity Fe2+ transport
MNDEAKEKSDVIEAAILSVMDSQDGWDEGDILVDWVVVAYAANPDREKGSAYPMWFSNGTMPGYRARGLLLTGLKSLDPEPEVE